MKRFNLTYTLLFCLSFAFGQSTTITGNVYDALTNTPLSNYTVTSNGGGGSTTTNASGAYTLVVPTTNDFHVIVAAQNGKCYRQKWTWGRKIIDFHLTACNFDRSRDSIALRSLYDNLNGAAWTSPWNIAQPITTWGLVYSSNGGGPIEFVGLDNRNLNGTFPTSATGFSNLRDLFGFDFSNNANLRGTLPSLSNMKQLDWVKLQNTGMSGDPLSSITGLKNIEMLSLRNNTSMSASFPSTLSTDWRNIYKLQLEGINVSGTIPTALFALPNVQTVGLGQNKLTGTVPALPSGNSSTIQYLVLNDNDLDSLPNLSVSTTLTALGVKGNRLTFDDIVPNISKFNAATVYEGSANTFVYAPQDSFFVDTTIRASENTPLSIDVKIDGALTNNKYKWYKNGVFFRSTTSNKLTFNNLAATDAGVYTCDVTNPVATDLTLYSRSITLVLTSCRTRDSLALVDLYNATGGANWTNRWALNLPMTTWFGVTLNAQGCVACLDLDGNANCSVSHLLNGNNLVGTLPASLDSLQNITSLYLDNNKLTGSIPNLTAPNLVALNLAVNQLTGSMPNFNLPSLQTLAIEDNQLSGAIPNFNLPNLQDLSLGNNKLSGTIPNFNLPNLKVLGLYTNQLTGSVPNFNLPNLTELYLHANQLSGSIPNFNLPKILFIFLESNKLTGTIPNFNLPTLQALYLGYNQLTGSLPNFVLPNLTQLNVSTNKLSGTIPNLKLAANTPNLTSASFSYNRFDSCAAFTNIASFSTNGLNLQGNRLTFDDVLPNVRTGLDLYNFQDSIFVDTTISATLGTPLSIDLKIDGALTTNTYKWYKNGALLRTTTTNKLTFASLVATDAGVYTCTVTNTLAPLLTLQSRNITIQIGCAAATNSQTVNKLLCAGQTYTSPSGKIFNTSGTYRDTLKTTNSCDSIIYTINLTITPSATSQVLTPSVCTVYTSPSGKIFNTSGTYRDTLKTTIGCDSILYTINLTIQNTATSQTLTPSVCTAFTSPSGKIFNTSGAYRDTVRTTNGCDSIRYTINLTVQNTATNQILTALRCITYMSPSGKVFTISGIYKDTLKTVNGCDSIRYTINLTIAPTATSQILTPSVCTAYLSPSGKDFTTSGTYQDTVRTINGCDSIRYTINLTIQNTATSQILNPSICPNQTYRSPSGKTFSTVGTKLDTLKNINGCDSIHFTINITIQTPLYQQIATQFICRGDVFGNLVLTRDTLLKDTLRSIALCDSVITTTLIKVNLPSVNNLNLSLCVGTSATVNGIVYNAANRSGQQILRAASAEGCDSIINITTSFVANMRAIDDEYTISDSTNTLNFNVLTNDFVSGNVKVIPLSKPIVGQLDTLGGGRFRYVFPPQTNGTATFNYSVCSTVCPSLCDTAAVKININRPRLAGDVSFGITPHCVCPNDRLIFSELELNPDKYPANELVIISRWGDVVYRAKPYHNDWTGTNEKGENLPAGTYYYIMRLAIADGKIKTGDVTIYR